MRGPLEAAAAAAVWSAPLERCLAQCTVRLQALRLKMDPDTGLLLYVHPDPIRFKALQNVDPDIAC